MLFCALQRRGMVKVMNNVRMTVAAKQVIVLVPDHLAAERKLQALWLIAPEGEDAETWIRNTNVLEYAETAKAVLICAPWDDRDLFYTETLWPALHEKFPALSNEPNGHRLLGLKNSAERCLKLVFRYPDRFCIAVAVCPTSCDDGKELLGFVKEYMQAEKARPRTVISDCTGGEGKRMGDAINRYGVDMHVHAERSLTGWALMDAEIKSCLAHL